MKGQLLQYYSQTLKMQLLQSNIEKTIISQTLKKQLLQLNIERAIITVKHWKGNYYSQTLKGQLLQSNIEKAIITCSWALKGQLFLYYKNDDFNFPIVNFPFKCSNIPAAPAYGVYISQLIRYSRACGSYPDFLDRGLLLTRVPLG